jgi:hypothetical protein
MWRARFGRGFGPVVRHTTKWMNEIRRATTCRVTFICRCRRTFQYPHQLRTREQRQVPRRPIFYRRARYVCPQGRTSFLSLSDA